MILENLRQRPHNTTLMGVVTGALEFFGLRHDDAWAYGGCGHAFMINIHEQLCPSGPYCWNRAGFHELSKNIGIAMHDLGFFHPESPDADKHPVEQQLREHLGRGLPCALVNLENQLITGHDDEKLFTAGPWPDNSFPPRTLTFGTWAEFGDKYHANFYRIEKTQPKDEHAVVTESLRYAIDVFARPDRYTSGAYGAGLRAYDKYVEAVEAGHGTGHGNWWNATVWSECRARASDYFGVIATLEPGAARQAHELGTAYLSIADELAAVSDKGMPKDMKIARLKELKRREAGAIESVQALLHVLEG